MPGGVGWHQDNFKLTDALESLQLRLGASTSEQDRAAGLALQMLPNVQDDRSDDAAADFKACDAFVRAGGKPQANDACTRAKASQPIWQSSRARFQRRIAPVADRLALLARSTADPAVYAQAIQACRQIPPNEAPPSCGFIHLEQWARLEPQNMAPHWLLLEQAQLRGDLAGAEEALFRISQSRSNRTHSGLVAQRLAAQAAAEPSDLELLSGTLQSMDALQTGVLQPPYGATLKLCSQSALADANRRQACDDVARALVSHGESLMANLFGRAIGARVGWPKAQLDSIGNEAQALAQVLWDSGSLGFDCESLRQTRERLLLVSQRGELGAAREIMRASGRNWEQVSRSSVQARESLQLKFSASSASAASSAQ